MINRLILSIFHVFLSEHVEVMSTIILLLYTALSDAGQHFLCAHIISICLLSFVFFISVIFVCNSDVFFLSFFSSLVLFLRNILLPKQVSVLACLQSFIAHEYLNKCCSLAPRRISAQFTNVNQHWML